MIIWVNGYGWVMGVSREDGMVNGLRFTKQKAGAKPFAGLYDRETEEVCRWIENAMKCHYDLCRDVIA